MLPVIRELEAEYAERVEFQQIDYYAEANRAIVQELGVRGHPTFAVIGRDGAPSRLLRGMVDKPQLVEVIEAALA